MNSSPVPIFLYGNEAVRHGPHGVAENVTGGGLDEVLHELRSVGLQPLLFLCAADTLVGDTLAAELICTELRLYIGKASAGQERNEEHPALVAELDSADLTVHVILHGIHSCPVDIPPELHDVLVRVSPSGDQRLKLVFRMAHLQGSHRFEDSD